MTAYDIIMKKRRGGILSDNEINRFVTGYVRDEIPDYQMSALLMAICFESMTAEETSALTMAMMYSGDTFHPSEELGRICIDKHSTGGVGDKTTLIAAPICAACGVYVPKMSGRGLGHTGGTIDKLEAIPGFCTSISHERFIETIRKAGFSIAGQSGTLVPADKKIYALRNATATVDSIPLICSSIMSKKLATGADGIVLDVKVGDGAFMKSYDDAEKLALAMISVGKSAGRKCTAVLTDMDKPLGHAVGNSVEVIEAIEALKGRCDESLYEVSITLAVQMLMLADMGNEESCRRMAESAINSGKALEAFKSMAQMQGADIKAFDDYSLFGRAERTAEVRADRSGYISKISCEKTGLVSLALGAGRTVKDGKIDSTAGIIFNCNVGSYVKAGDILGTVMTSSECDFEKIKSDFYDVFSFDSKPVSKRKAVLKIIESE